MKKIFLIAAMAILTFSAYAQNQKFAHVNYNELVTLMPEADVAREKLAAQSKEFEQTYQDMASEFQNKLSQYQQKASTWTAAIKESKEKELNDIQTRLQEFQQTAQGELQQQQQELMAPIYKKAQDVVGRLAKEGGYIYVFEKTSLLYVDEAQSKDLTAAARKALNIPDSRTMESLQAELQAQQQAVQK
ncbi:MAG: OmpH family outer membrane protein [Candidatus Cryptobacteroides sp.]